MESLIEKIEFLLLLAAIVAMVARKLHLPYSVGLVLAGIGLTFVHPFNLPITKELIFTVLLELPNVVATAHSAAWTTSLPERRYRFIAANIARMVAGQPLLNQVWPPAAAR